MASTKASVIGVVTPLVVGRNGLEAKGIIGLRRCRRPGRPAYGEDHDMRIEDIEGIGPVNAAKLQDAGVRTTDDLLPNGGSRAVEH
jgi:hypothetical protein